MAENKMQEEYAKHEFHPWVMEELNTYIIKRERYKEEKTTDSKIEFKKAYEDIFLSTKHAMHEGQITERDFHKLIRLLQEE